MNIFKTTDNGGLPLALNDFRWIDAGYREAFKALMSGYGVVDSEAVIISGCERTLATGTVSIAEGYISLGGEICLVPAHTYPEPTGGQLEYWDLYTSFDPEGYKVFQSTLDYDTYQKRIAKITVASSVPAGYTEYADTKNIFQITRLKINTGIWNEMSNVVVTGGTIPGTYISQFKKDSCEFIHFKGTCYFEDAGSGTVNELLGTLPAGYRPDALKTFVIGHNPDPSTGEMELATVTIATSGEVRLKSLSGDYAGILDMSQIPPFEGV